MKSSRKLRLTSPLVGEVGRRSGPGGELAAISCCRKDPLPNPPPADPGFTRGSATSKRAQVGSIRLGWGEGTRRSMSPVMSTAPSVDLPKAPSFRLDGKRALVTGAGRGIGLAAASALADAGAHVTLVSRTREEIEQAAAAIRARGQGADALVLDVTDLAAVQAAIAAAAPFNILVNNAGTNRPKLLLDVTIEDFDAIMGLNVRAAYFVAQAVARGLIEAKQGGSIVNISSQMGHVGGARRTVYCASKHAMEGFTKAMAIELAPHDIRVNTVGPTFIETPLTKPFFENEAFRNSVLAKIKLGRIGQVDDLTGAIVFLASDASALMTGSALVVDGGWTAE